MMKRSYDLIAGIYDRLANIFIGKALRHAQVYLVQHIPPGAKVLIAGGGTGWILEEIAKVHPADLQIDYLDISTNMVRKANGRNVQQNTVRFLHQSAADNFEGNDYDVIITPFFFDNFKEETMQRIFNNLHQRLKQNGLWLYADFQVSREGAFYQNAMLFVMYTFFRTICNIEADRLPNVETQFAKSGYQLMNKKTFKQDFIISQVYKKGY